MDLQIYTKHFANEIMCWQRAENIAISDCTEEGDYKKYSLAIDDGRKITDLMKNLVLLQNPILKRSANLSSYIKKSVNKPLDEKIDRDFAEFIEKNPAFTLEGYIAFRLIEYSFAIDLIIYSLVKKMNLTFIPE